VAENAQALQLEETRREHALKILAQLAQRDSGCARNTRR
jgi:hypothetical protein